MVPRRAAVDFLCFPMVNHLLSPVTQEVSAYHLPEQTLSMRKSGPNRVRFEPRKRPSAAFRVEISGSEVSTISPKVERAEPSKTAILAC